ncbi:MAG TPA: type II toxin-antitoxin system VapC family toxin [Caulobacteraceae bacterium]
MIVVDTSALMAIVLGEPSWRDSMDALVREERVMISAGTLAEALIVAARRGKSAQMTELIEGLGIEVIAVGASGARGAARAHDRWGRGVHPAGLNFGDCFAYALAEEHSCPLLFVGDDFARTDVQGCL